MPIENIREFRSFGAWNGSFAYSLQASFQVAKVAGPRNHRPDVGLQTERSLSMMQDFRQSSEAVGLL